MLPQRKLAVDIQEAMENIIAHADTKKDLNYQLPIYIERLKRFKSIDFKQTRGITHEYVKSIIDDILTPKVYTGIPKNLYMIDSDNIAFLDLVEWKVLMMETLGKIRCLLDEYKYIYYTAWY